MPDPIRYDATLAIRCSEALPRLVKRAALRRGVKEAEWLRGAVAASLRAEGLDPTEPETQYALVANGAFVEGRNGGPLISFRPEPDDRGEWVPIENEDAQPFDPARHYRMAPFPLRLDGGRVVRVYPIVAKSEAV